MNHWRSTSGALAALLWSVILLSSAFGCGNSGTSGVGLPNGYTLMTRTPGKFWVDDSDGQRIGDKHFSVAECQVDGDLFFGTYNDYYRNPQRTSSYFIIDTAEDKYQPFMDKDEWEAALRDQWGVQQTKLVSVRDFVAQDEAAASRFMAFSIIGAVLGTLSVIAFVVWAYTRSLQRAIQDRL
ncbi:MAG: hypothetical protein ACF8MF_08850 [Phycisphaerales bacterium JB052]